MTTTGGCRQGTSVSRLIGALALVLSLGGCVGMQALKNESMSNALQATASKYRKAIRWGHYDEARMHLRARDDEEAVPGPAVSAIAAYRVTSYESTDRIIDPEAGHAVVVAAIDYYNVNDGVVQTLRDEQRWWYDLEGKRWYLESGLPDFPAMR